MDENSLRSALQAIASDSEPAATIDIAAACRSGRRRQRAVRIAASAAVALAVVMAVTIPSRLFPYSSANPSVPAAPSVPAQFDPLVPYADFGLLPPGFTEAPALFSASGSARSLQRVAQAPNEKLWLSVNLRGQCRPPSSKGDSLCYSSGPFTRLAPLNGRPAWGEWDTESFSSSFIWEYAPGAFASLQAGVIKFTQTPLSFARLREIAARVKFEQRRPVTFPFRLTGVPAGWQVRDVQGRVSLSDVGCDVQLDIGPASGLVSALQLSLVQQAPSCKGFDPPPTSGKRVTKYGVTWYYYPASGKDPYAAESISTAGPSAATGGLGIAISVHVPSPYGDAYEVFHRMTLLGTSPANWTTRPLG